MQIVIDMPEEVYKDIMIHNREMRESGKSAYYFEGLIQHGISLPKGHGRLIDADDYIGKHEACGWLDDIALDEFNAITPTIIEADNEEKV